MLERFTWGEFLVAVALLNAVWYGMVVPWLYRKELSGVLGRFGVMSGEGVLGIRNGDRKAPAFSPALNTLGNGRTLDGGTGEKVEDRSRGNAEMESLMGASRLPEGVEVISSSGVAFSGNTGEGKYERVGLVADVVQELKLIFLDLEKKDQGKPEFFGRVARLNEDYGPLSGHPNLGAINEFIRSSAPFALSGEELDNLWY